MSKKNYSKTVDRMNMSTVLMLFISVGLLIADDFVDGSLSTFLLVMGLIGLVAFVFMVMKSGKMMAAEDKAKEEQLMNPSYPSVSTRDLLHRNSMENDSQYRM